MGRASGALLLCWLFGAVPATAQDGESAPPLTVVEEEILILASPLPSPLDRTGASASVVGEEELEVRQSRAAEEAIRPVPGVYVRGGSPGAPTSIFLRGAASNQLVVLVDGVQANDPTVGGQFNFFDVGLENVERVEVLRGAATTLYGSEAAGGVVSLVTRRGRGEPSARVLTEGGSFGRYLAALSGQGSVGPVSFAAGLSRNRAHNEGANHEFLADTVALALGLEATEGLRLTGRTRYVDSEAEDPWDFPFGSQIEKDPNIRRTRNALLWHLGAEYGATDWLDVSLSGSIFRSNALFTNGPDAPGDPIELRSRSEADVRNLTLHTRWTLPEVVEGLSLRALLGVEYEDEISESRVASAYGPTPDLERSVRNRAAFAVIEAEVLEALVLSGGIRRDRNSFFGWETTASASALFTMAETGTRLRGNYGEAFRAPKPVEFDDPFIGNPNLGPEESVHFDVGIEQDLLDGDVVLAATFYEVRTSDLIAYDPATFLLQNLSRTVSKGWELSAEAHILPGLFVRGRLNLQDARNLTAVPGAERQLVGRPKRFGGGEVRYEGEAWRVGVEVEASDDYPGTGKITPDGTHRSHPGRKLLVTIRGAVRVCSSAWLHARIENLLDDEWYDDETAPGGLGRGLYVGLTVDLR